MALTMCDLLFQFRHQKRLVYGSGKMVWERKNENNAKSDLSVVQITNSGKRSSEAEEEHQASECGEGKKKNTENRRKLQSLLR